MQVPTLPSDLAILVAGLATVLSHWLRDDGLSPKINAAIALVAFLIIAAACIFLTIGFTGNIKDDTWLLIAMAVALAGKEGVALLSYLQDAGSPLKSAPTTPSSVKPAVADWTNPGSPTHGG